MIHAEQSRGRTKPPAAAAGSGASALFSLNLAQTAALGARLAMTKPRAAKTLKRLIAGFPARDRIRGTLAASGLTVPALMIVSLTRQCNLACAGCYAGASPCGTGTEMDAAAFRTLLSEAEQLGVNTVMLAGGEPLLRQDLLDVAAGFGSTLFIVFSNGTRLNDTAVGFFRENAHIVPVLSLEGNELETDARRGAGTHAAVQKAMQALQAEGCLFGASITVTMRNLGTAISNANAITAGLREALRSPLLRAVRGHHGELTETRGGCALAGKRADVEAWLAADIGVQV